MASFTQTDRLLSVNTPLGADVLLLTSFTGREAMSQLFSYQLDLFSEQKSIDPTQIVGKSVTWSIQRVRKEPRYFNGFVSRFSAGGRQLHNVYAYRAEVVPWLWFLTRTTDCRIFQNKTAPDIIKAVFDGLGFSDYKLQLRNTYPQREYCVQYRESAFNFVSRLMEQEGIFYFFKHDNGKHTLILADQTSAYQDCPESQVDFSSGTRASNHLTSWDHQYEFRPGKWTQTDYNFETPSTNLLTSTNTVLKVPGMTKFEIFDYPGGYFVKGQGDARTKLHMEAEESSHDIVNGGGQCSTFTPGGKFTIATHEVDAEVGKSYVVTSIQHAAADHSYFDSDRGSEYGNQFTCIPAAVPCRPARDTHKPIVRGPQTAIIVGPKGEEIYTDKYGRVKVQFFWDRVGKKDENSSCWVRVAEAWAGKNWGVIFNPRIGQEVVVDFLDGDPDRPLITGRVYNAEQMPPYDLPAHQTQSVIKTRSSKNGSTDNFNELRFEDKKGSEEIVLHAERDFSTTVEHDETVQVYHNRTVTIGGGKNNTDPKKDGTHTETIEGDVKITLQKGDYALTVQQGKMTVQVNKEVSLSSTTDAIHVQAATQIKLECGASSLLLKNDGTIELTGVQIKITGSATVTSEATAVNTVKGGMVKINC